MSTRKNPPKFGGNVGKAFIQSKIINCLRGGYGKVVSKEEIAAYISSGGVWTDGWAANLNTQICHLRKKGWPIRTYWGRGYSYDPSLIKAPADAAG